MSDFRILAMEEYLKELADKRRILEQKCQIRQVTSKEFQALRQDTIRSSQHRMAASNDHARSRNIKMLEDINAAVHQSSTRALLEDSKLLSSAARLQASKESYMQTASQMLPAWRSQRSDMQLQAAAKLREQRGEIERRRQQDLQAAEEELKNTIILEEERRQYLLAVALHNKERDYVTSQTRSLLAESQAVDYLMMKEVEKYQQHAQSRDSRVLQEMKDRLAAAMDAQGGASAAEADINRALDVYQGAMTSPEFIAKTLREAPLPQPVTVGASDMDLAQRQARLVVLSEQDRPAEPIGGKRAGAPQPLDYPVEASPGSVPDRVLAMPRAESAELTSTGKGSDRKPAQSTRKGPDLSVNTQYNDSDSDDEEEKRDRSEVIPVRAVTPTSNRKLLTPQSSFELSNNNGGEVEFRAPSFSTAAGATPLEASPSHTHLSESNKYSYSRLQSPTASFDSRAGNVSFSDVSPRNVSRIMESFADTPLIPEGLSTEARIELVDKLCRRLEVLDDVSRERGVDDSDRKMRRDDQYMTAIQAYRKASRVVLGFSVSTDVPAASENHAKTQVPQYLHDLCKAIMDGRERETALFGIEAVAESLIHLSVEIGPYLLPSDILNGVITEEKVHRNMKRLGEGRWGMWSTLTSHLKGVVSTKGAKAEELSRIFTAALVMHVPRGDEQHRAERKIRTLLQLEIMPKEADPKDSIDASSISYLSMNETKPLGDISVSDNIAPLKSEPAKPLRSPRSASVASHVNPTLSTPVQPSPEMRQKALKALGSGSVDSEVENVSPSKHTSSIVTTQASNANLRAAAIGGRHQRDGVGTTVFEKKDSNTSDQNVSLTSALPQSSKFRTSSHEPSKHVPASKKWTSVKNMISIEDDELASDDDAIAAPPPTKLLEENDSDSNEFDF